jgi:hypothetical protein
VENLATHDAERQNGLAIALRGFADFLADADDCELAVICLSDALGSAAQRLEAGRPTVAPATAPDGLGKLQCATCGRWSTKVGPYGRDGAGICLDRECKPTAGAHI